MKRSADLGHSMPASSMQAEMPTQKSMFNSLSPPKASDPVVFIPKHTTPNKKSDKSKRNSKPFTKFELQAVTCDVKKLDLNEPTLVLPLQRYDMLRD
jgi:hypothetical protein